MKLPWPIWMVIVIISYLLFSKHPELAIFGIGGYFLWKYWQRKRIGQNKSIREMEKMTKELKNIEKMYWELRYISKAMESHYKIKEDGEEIEGFPELSTSEYDHLGQFGTN